MSTTTETPQVRARVQALITGAWSTQVIHVAVRLEVFDGPSPLNTCAGRR